MKKLTSILLSAILVFGISGVVNTMNAQQSPEAIKELLQQRDRQIKDLLGPEGTEYTKENRQELKDIINGVIDYGAMAKYALQDTYNEISADEQKEFVDLFSTIIRDHSLNQLDIYRSDVTYRNIELDGNEAIANTMAQRKNVRTPVIYKLYYEQENGEWVVIDFSIDDVSTADSYQRQFQNIIRKDGFDKLMNNLRKRASR
jgi:phospholipid transport system substrate-binding protein